MQGKEAFCGAESWEGGVSTQRRACSRADGPGRGLPHLAFLTSVVLRGPDTVPWVLHIASSRHITSQVHVGLRTGAAVTSGVSVPQDLDTRCQGGLEYGHREGDASVVQETAYLAGESD